MATVGLESIARQFDRLYEVGTLAGLDEVQLLERFHAQGDEEAFAALVARHGPMVLAVCLGVLRDPHEADDAFQATFLVLARKAGTIRGRSGLAPWLHRVAVRVAIRSSRSVARRRRREVTNSTAATEAVESRPPGLDPDVSATIQRELDRLPESHRLAVIACDLEGLTHEEAAARLRWPVGSVKGRLARGRRQLRDRLARRGLAGTLTSITAILARDSRAGVSSMLIRLTARAASEFAAGKPVAGLVPASAVALARGAANAMIFSPMRTLAILAISMSGVAAGLYASNQDPTLAGGESKPPLVDSTTTQPGQSSDESESTSDANFQGPPSTPPNDQDPKPRGLSPEERHAISLRIMSAEEDLKLGQTMLDELNSLATEYFSMVGEVEFALALPGKTVWLRGREIPREDVEKLLLELQGKLGRSQLTRNTYRNVIRTNRAEIIEARAALETPDAAPRKLKPGDIVVIEVLEALAGRPITGERTVRQDGSISLKYYGDLDVAGLDRVEIKKKLIEHLRESLTDAALGLVGADAEGREITIPPEKSNRVFVDVTLWRPEIPKTGPLPSQSDRRIDELERRLDEAVREIERLRSRDR